MSLFDKSKQIIYFPILAIVLKNISQKMEQNINVYFYLNFP